MSGTDRETEYVGHGDFHTPQSVSLNPTSLRPSSEEYHPRSLEC